MSRKLLRWVSWSVGILLVLVFVAALGVSYYTRTPQFRALLRAKILAAANDALNGELRFKEITGSVWRDLEFHDFAIVQNGETILSAPVVSIDLGLWGQVVAFLSASTIRIGQIDIVEPELKLVQDEEKNWNLAKLVKKQDKPEEPGQQPRSMTISLRNIRIKDGKLQARTADGKEARITALSGEADIDLPPSGPEINLNKLGFALSSSGVPDSTWSTTLSLKQSDKTSSLEIKGLSIATARSRLDISGTIDNFSSPTTKLSLDLTRLSAEEIRQLSPAVPLREDIAGRIRASGPLSALQVSATFTAPSGQVVTSTVANLKGEKPEVQGSLELKEFVVDRVLALSGVKGKVNGQVAFKGGSLDDAQASLQGRVSGLAFQEWTIGQMTLSSQLQNRRLAFTAQSEEKNGTAELQAALVLSDTPSYEANLRTRAFDLKKIATQKPGLPAAKINMDAWVKGSGTKPETMQADTRLTLTGSEINGIQLDQARAEGSLRNGTLVLKEVRLAADGSTLSANGTIASVAQNAKGRITYGLNAKDINPWLKLAGIDASGSLKIDGSIAGSLQAPQLDGKANFNQLQMAAHRVQSGSLRWTLAGSRSNSWQGKIDLAAQHVTAGISLPSLEAHVNVDGTRPAALTADIVARDVDQRIQRINGRVTQSGERTEIALQQLSLQLPDGTWRNARPARFVVAGKNVTVDELVLQRETQTLNVKGAFGLEGPQDLSVRVNGFSLADLRPYLKGAPDVNGSLALTLQVKGSATQPLIDSTMSVDKLSVAGQTYADLKAQSSYQKEQLSIDLRLLQDKAHGLNVKGTLPVYIGWGGDRSIAVTGDSNLRIQSDGLNPTFVSAFSKEIDNLQGSLSMDVVLRGPLQALAPNGTIQFQNGAVRVRPVGLSLSEIALQADLTPGAIQISRLTARSGGGQLNGTGRLTVKGSSITNIAANLKTQDFQVINTQEYKANASGNLAASGNLQEPVVRGDLTVKGTLRPDMGMLKGRGGKAAQDTTIVVVQNESQLAAEPAETREKDSGGKGGSSSQEQASLFQRLRLDVAAGISRGTWIYLDEGSVEVTGQLKIKKEPKEQLTVAGNVQGNHGWYSFQGRRFQMEKAELLFTGGSQIDPGLDIVARYKVSQYQVDLVIGGTASKPTLALRSNPTLEQADILSVLLFGKPTADLNQGEKNALQSQALKTAANFISSDLRQSVASKLGVDTLEFGVGDNLSGGEVSAGKYVTQDVFVSTKQQLGGEQQQQEYAIEYDIAPNWQLRSSTSPQGKSGSDIFWRKRY
jgi:autotransporter translocation and assembly factor TamB